MQALVETTEYSAKNTNLSINMQDKRLGLQAHVDEWEQDQNNSINIESTVAMEIIRLSVLLFGEVFSFFLFSLHNVAEETGELRFRMSFCDR